MTNVTPEAQSAALNIGQTLISAALASDKPISADTAPAAITLFNTGKPTKARGAQAGASSPTIANRRRRLLQTDPPTDNSGILSIEADAAQAAAVAALEGMLEALAGVQSTLARGASPSDAYLPAGAGGTYVSEPVCFDSQLCVCVCYSTVGHACGAG